MKEYEPKEIEKKWQKEWEDSGLYNTPDLVEGKKNEYILVEFAYPSGNLHVGHWYAFSVSDIYARFRRMSGANVMFPFGFDAFGLPAENAAIKRSLNPRDWTYNNITYMRSQLHSMGAMFDWSREITTSDPEYYKWTQWLFIKLFERGLAYRAMTDVNWCPSCKTVLANEQVVDDKCERCGTAVEKKEMKQWMLRITDYADRLINDLEGLDWPQPIKEAQKNWIGRSAGAEISFDLASDGNNESSEPIRVFTTRPDTLYGVTFIALAGKEDKFTGKYALHPATGERLPIWEAEYVMGEVGTGAVMGVPSDDERDRVFAEKHNLSVMSDYKKDGYEKYIDKEVVRYKLHDWVISRQRYWGCPIPVIHCKKCGVSVVPEEDLPVVLPEIDDFLPRDDGRSPLAKAVDWVNVKCPKCGAEAERETDTFDTFIDSSWYFLRYADPKNDKEFASKDKLEKWMPVNFYSGGAEHTTMHLLYSRFFHKALFDVGLVVDSEPFSRRMNRSLILGPDGQKMSKSKGNVIDPDKEVEKFGADTIRTYLAFIGPYNEVGAYPWNPDGIVGVRRFLERVFRLQSKISSSAKVVDEVLVHQTIKKVSESVAMLKMNTGVAALMIFTNALDKRENISVEECEILALLLAPFAPHLAEEIWSGFGHETSVHLESWPLYDPAKARYQEMSIAVQINGKVRAMLDVSIDLSEEEALEMAKNLPAVNKWIGDAKVRKVIYKPGKILNIVI